ncbi:SPOR domain-containing protein [Desulfatirhabdium butyrativorans]|uniref:SPOR domain-containing protein n=1 Tax=Desulfatirhabdium butyrativorans TaxID=340467 RepID=UPI0003F56DB6|nr:tetratricopeptide repeat protein [Desulfatirhabdium butyrativorans]
MMTSGTRYILCLLLVLVLASSAYADDKASLGRFLLRVQRYEDALVVYNELIGKRSTDSQLYHNRGVAYMHTGHLEKALNDFNEAIAIDPKNAEAYNSRGVCWFYKGDYEKAVADYAKAIEHNPQLTRAYNQLAWALAVCPNPKIRNGARAVEMARKAVELEPSAYHYDTLAAAYAEAGHFKDAVKIQKRALLMQLTEGRTQALERYTERLRSYEVKKPWREKNAAGMRQAEAPAGKSGHSPITITAITAIGEDAAQRQFPKEPEPPRVPEPQPMTQPVTPQPEKQPEPQPQITAPPKEPPPSPGPVPIASPSRGIGVRPFSIIVATSQYRQKAYRIAMKLRSKGDSAFIVQETDPGAGESYKIYLGNFASAIEAWDFIGARLKNQFRDPQVVYLPYAVMIGRPASKEAIKNQEASFLSKGYWAYSCGDPKHPEQARMLIGAFEKDTQAIELATKLQQWEKNVQVVLR